MMKFVTCALLGSSAAAVECRDAATMDSSCDLELVPGGDVMTLAGVTKICGMMFTAHVYASYYANISTEIQAYCTAVNETTCCPTANLGMLSANEGCNTESGKETKSCETGNEAGKPDTEGSYTSWVAYSTNAAGSPVLKAFMGCDATCGASIIAKLTALNQSAPLVAALLAEFKGDAAELIPSLYPLETLYQGKLYPGECKDQVATQTMVCGCAFNNSENTFCNQDLTAAGGGGGGDDDDSFSAAPTNANAVLAVALAIAMVVA